MKSRLAILLTLSSFTLCQVALSAQVGGQQLVVHEVEPPFFSRHAGWSVAPAGDVNQDGYADILLGAPTSHTAAVHSGKDGRLLFSLSAPAGAVTFGRSVDTIGDVDSDGYPDFIIGDEWGSASSFGREGGVSIFSGKTGSRIRTLDGQNSEDFFGWAVAGAGDVNGDGVNDYMAGAPHADSAVGNNSGEVTVYSGISSQLLFSFEGTTVGGQLGYALDAAGDVNNDGFADIIIGEPAERGPNGRQRGAVYVISGFDQSRLYKFIGTPNESFGESVAGVGDMNGDGFDDIAVGASRAELRRTSSQGRVTVFSGADGRILHTFWGQDGEHLGWSIDGAGDLDGDGFSDIVIGGTTLVYDGNQPDGNAWIYSGATGTLLTHFAGTNSQSLGYAVAGVGDVNNDGLSDVIFGAPYSNEGIGYPPGKTYVISFRPFLNTSNYLLSATTGGTTTLDLDFPHSEGNAPYLVLISGRGMANNFWRGNEIPLIQDRIFLHTSHGLPLPMLQNGFGYLDSAGNATATFTVPAFAPISLIGTTRWFAAVSFDPLSLQVEKVSVALPLTIAP